MKIFNRKSLITRLIWSVAIPEIIIFSFLAWYSYEEISDIFNEKYFERSELIYDEVNELLTFLDISIGLIDLELNSRLEQISDGLINQYLLPGVDPEKFNLKWARSEMGFDSTEVAFFIIDDGKIINSTVKEELGRDLYKFNPKAKEHLHKIQQSGEIEVQDFFLHPRTFNVQKFSYQSTIDKKYIVSVFAISDKGREIVDIFRNRLNLLSEKNSEIVDVDILMNYKRPWSFMGYKLDSLDRVFVDSASHDSLRPLGTPFIRPIYDSLFPNAELVSEYRYYMRDKNSIFNYITLKTTLNRTIENEWKKERVINKLKLFALGLTFLLLILIINGTTIVNPLKKIEKSVLKVGEGDLSLSVPVVGNLELQNLAKSFNKMTEGLRLSEKKILDQKEKIEEAHKEITDSISYARRIQEAILPPTKLVKEYLTESFILYMPKDIVAGDFYWFDVHDDEVFFAAADCTGHGVPGAMVSVVCANALTRVVGEMKITEPAAILDNVRELVVKNFEKSEQEVKDGMDISFCKLNLKTKELTYAGANNPLYRITKLNGEADDKTIQNETHMLIEYKGDKQPIGKHANEKPFTQQKIQLLEGDSIFISSDGYPDQFGGPEGRKFMYKQFKKLFLSLNEEAMDRQREQLIEAFNQWKGQESQVDDVCVIGVKV